MHIRTLEKDEIIDLYSKYLEVDFPDDELKPLSIMLDSLEKGIYDCIGLFESDRILAYAYFVHINNDYLCRKINEILNKIDGIKVKEETSHIVYSLPDNILPKDIKPYEEWTKEMEQLHKGREQNKNNVAKPHSSDPIYDLILNIDYSTLTPVKAMNIISELQNEVKKVLNNSN